MEPECKTEADNYCGSEKDAETVIQAAKEFQAIHKGINLSLNETLFAVKTVPNILEILDK